MIDTTERSIDRQECGEILQQLLQLLEDDDLSDAELREAFDEGLATSVARLRSELQI